MRNKVMDKLENISREFSEAQGKKGLEQGLRT